MKKLFLLAALCVAAAFSSCSKHDNEINHVEPPVPPETTPLAITFAEGNSLEFNVGETKTAHYTITGGSDKTVVKAELQTPDDAYTVETTPSSISEGTITITAQTPETENCVIVTVSDGSQTVTAEIAVSTKPAPEELAITFAEGNSLEFNVGETQTVHYTITGGSAGNVVKAEMQNLDDAYTLKTTPTSTSEGTIAITAKLPTTNNVIVTVSDGDESITAEIAVALKASFDGKTAVVVTPGTLAELLSGYDTAKIIELTVIGNLNDEDIATLKNLPNLSILDMENVNLEVLPNQAFYKTSLTSVKLPKTLKIIGNYAFSFCSSLTSITIPDSVTTIGEMAFYNCSGLKSVTIGNSVTEIGYCAFCNCSSLTSVTIPDSIKSLLPQTFWDCSSLNAFYGKFASSDNRCLIIGSTLIDFAPAGLTSYTIPSSVRNIDRCAFSGCSNLTSITIPNSVTSIGDSAFYSCSNLTSITIPSSVRNIDRCAFSGCSNLTSVTIPNSVTTIGDKAFCQCSSLSAFYGKFASSDNRYLIVDGCLNSFAPAGLTAYTIPDSVTSIGGGAFSYCNSLTSVTIGNGVTTIEDGAFCMCNNLTSITIPDSVTEIGDSAFSFCSSLTSVTIPDSVTTIGEMAFYNCSGLKSVTIGNSVTSIGYNAFQQCLDVTSIYCKATVPPSVPNYAFCAFKATLYVPTGCKVAYVAAGGGWSIFKTIEETQF